MGQPVECALWGSLWNVDTHVCNCNAYMTVFLSFTARANCVRRSFHTRWYHLVDEMTSWNRSLKFFSIPLQTHSSDEHSKPPIYGLKSNQVFCVYFIAVPLCRRLFNFMLIQICRSLKTITDSSSVCSVNILGLLSFRIVNCALETQPIFRIFCFCKGRYISLSLSVNCFNADFLPALRVRRW